MKPGSLGGGPNPPTIYVLSHGWAPGYRSVVDTQGGNVLWWGANASVNNLWTSDWAWAPVTVPLEQPFTVNSTGLLPSIAAFDPQAVVLAWSWIDDSATESGDFNIDEVYSSEAYTHVNGIRLANALEEAIDPYFWNEATGLLRLIGHSHGSKVATVAALTLQQRGRRVAHLTILDSPESEMTLEGNGANLLGFYLEQMQIENPSYDCASGAFVDNYASCFGVGYTGTPNLKNIVEVALQPAPRLYDDTDYPYQHSYAAAWYGGAAAGAAGQGEPPLGFAWPPQPKNYLPALNQNWPTGTNQYSQWQLQPGPSVGDSFSYSTQPLKIKTVNKQGSVYGDPATKLTFRPSPGTWPAYSIFHGSYDNSPDSDNYGISFDLVWTAPQIGDYLVVTSESPDLGEQETLLVMDGQSYPAGKTSVAINCDVSSWLYSIDIYIYFLAAQGNSIGQVALSNFNFVVVGSASGYLRARRLAAAAEKTARRSLRAPKRNV